MAKKKKSKGIPALDDDTIEEGIKFLHLQRSQKAQDVDDCSSANLTENPFLWMSSPNRHDFPGIDTRVKKDIKPKKKSAKKLKDVFGNG